MRSNIFDKLSFAAIFLVVVLLPVFFLPFTNVPIEISKGFLLVTGLSVSLILWVVGRFFDGEISLPKSPLIVAGGAVVAVYLLSALLSDMPQVSLFGAMFDVGSFWFIFAGFMLMAMSAILFRTGARAKILLFGLVLSSVALVIFQGLYLFMPEVFSLGILSGTTGNLFGSWNALGLFTGFAALMFLLVSEFFPIGRAGKILLHLFLLLALLLAAAVNFYLVWVLLGISSLIIFVYKASLSFRQQGEDDGERRFPAASFVVVVISILFIVSSQFIGSFIPGRLGISNTEVNPSFGATMGVTKSVIVKDPLLGIGPNRFNEAWALYKPMPVNNTVFWDVPFEVGSGLLPTFFATIGSLGILAWLVFLATFLVSGTRSAFATLRSGANWEVMAYFVLSLYLFVSVFLYSGGMALFLLALAFTGIFIGLAAGKRETAFSFADDHRKSFFSMLVLIVLVIASIILAFKYYERFASVPHLRRALAATDVMEAEAHIGRAIALNPSDVYLRTYSQIYVVKLNSLIQAGASDEKAKAELQATLDQAVRSAELAVAYNPDNYLNLRLLGAVYEMAGSLGAEGGYEKALAAYERSAERNPSNPGLKLAMSRVAAAAGKTADALAYAEAALALAPNDQGLIQYVRALRNRTSAPPPVPPVPEPETTTE